MLALTSTRWAVCCSRCCAVTRRFGPGAAGMLMKHLSEAPPAIGPRSIPVPEGAVDADPARLLGKTPEERLPTMREVEQALERGST